MINEAYPILLDGGLSNQLEKQGCDLNHKMWTARLLMDDPDQIVTAHLAYLLAGSQIITTASYQATFAGYSDLGIGHDKTTHLIRKSVELASRAVEKFKAENPGHNPLIAASIGPYGAYLADGSEYRGDYSLTTSELHLFHAEKIALLDQSDANLLACETIPNYQEAQVLGQLIADCNTPAWISFSCKDGGHINDGTPIEKCVELFKECEQVFAVGINCTAPRFALSLIEKIKRVDHDKRVVVYPNAGTTFNPVTKSWSSRPDDLEMMVVDWVKAGADIVGGCCQVGPEEINRMGQMLKVDH